MSAVKVFPASLVLKHFATLRTGGRVLHVGLPLVATIGAYLTKATISELAIPTAITALSVFVGLLFSLLVLASSLRLANRGSILLDRGIEAGRAILVNTQFSILVAFAAIGVLFPSTVEVRLPDTLYRANEFARGFVTPIFVGFCTSFAITLLQVLAKMSIAMERNLELTYAAAPEIANRPALVRDKAADG